MKKISKRLICALLAVVMVVAMSACGEEEKKETVIVEEYPDQRMLVEVSDEYKIVRIVYNAAFNEDGYEPVYIQEFDEAKVLECMAKYQEIKTDRVAGDYDSKDAQFQIIIKAKGDSKRLFLGDINCCNQGNGKPEYEIPEAETLRTELLEILGKSEI